MVKAILAGNKTQTRRVIRNPEKYSHIRDCGFCCPHGQPGDRLWVRETWRCNHIGGHRIEYRAGGACLEYHDWPKDVIPPYVASDSPTQIRRTERQLAGEKIPDAWRSPFHMPRWASRITLEITEVRVERLQEINDEDCWAEGLFRIGDDLKTPAPILICSESRPRPGMAFAVQPRPVATYAGSPFMTFAFLWDSINNPRDYCPEDAPNGWDANPYVWAITFKRLKP
jgi:hypothetical protein